MFAAGPGTRGDHETALVRVMAVLARWEAGGEPERPRKNHESIPAHFHHGPTHRAKFSEATSN